VTLQVALLLITVVVVGMGISYLSDVDFAVEERVAYGAFFGLIVYVISTLVTTRLFSFGGMGVMAGIMLALMVSLPGWRIGASKFGEELADMRRRFFAPPREAGNHTLFGLLFIIPGWIWAFRLLSIAYRDVDGGILSGNLAIYSDWQAHSTYTASFAFAGNTGFDLPMATGNVMQYHNAINFFAATLVPSGASLHAALTISSGFCAFFFPMAMYLAGHRIWKSRWVAALGTAIFFLFGGWGWTHFFSTSRRTNPADLGSGQLTNVVDNGLLSTWGELPTRYTRFYDAGYWMENPVVGHLYPQRPTLIGFPVTIIVVMLLWSAYQRRSRQTFLFAGVIVGLMPFFHLFGFGTPLALGMIWAVFAQFEDREFDGAARTRLMVVAFAGFALFLLGTLVAPWHQAAVLAAVVTVLLALVVQIDPAVGLRSLEWRGEWLWFMVPAVVLAAPVVWAMLPPSGGSEPDYGFSWAVRAIQGNMTDVATGQRRLTGPDGAVQDLGLATTIWENITFWTKNFGFFLPLLLASQFVRRAVPTRIAVALIPVWLWFIVPTFTRLHPWEGNNTHYLIFVILLGAFPVAALLIHVVRNAPILGMLVPFIVLSMTLSGVLDLRHSGDTDTEAWPLMSAGDVIVADWVRENTDKDAVFVVADDNTHPMSSLTGRRIVAGFNGWIFDLGIPDWSQRTADSAHILQGGENTPIHLQNYGVDYVVLGPREFNNKQANQAYWDDNGQLVYSFGGYRIYRVI